MLDDQHRLESYILRGAFGQVIMGGGLHKQRYQKGERLVIASILEPI